MPDNSRAENWLLDLVVEMRYPLCVFTNEEIEMLLNREGHGLSETELVKVLYRLFSDGLIVAVRYILDEDEVYFNPTTDEIKLGLYARGDSEDIYYGLTEEGGNIWESRSNANWEKYVAESHSTDAGEIISMALNLARRAFDFNARESQSSTLIENQVWDVVSPWEAAYWKTLPLGHRVRFDETLFSEEEVQRRQEQEAPEAWQRLETERHQWWQERNSWYTRPW